MQDFRGLEVWKKSHMLALATYGASARFPACERYGVTSQLRRAAVSIAANIAEGCGRGSDADFARFVQHALGSASELEYHLLLARDLGYLAEAEARELSDDAAEVMRMLSSLRRRLRPQQHGASS
jgi:four helix bundle protein